jgi:hypothetical protein
MGGAGQRFEIGDRVEDRRKRERPGRRGKVIGIRDEGGVQMLTVEWDDGIRTSGPAERFDRVP